MKPFYILFCVFVIFGHTAPITEAGLLDPLRNIFNPLSNNNNKNRQDQMYKQLLSPFRDNSQAYNSEYAPHNSGIHLSVLNHPRIPFYDPNNSRLPIDDPNNTGFSIANPSNSPLENPGISQSSQEIPSNSRISLEDHRNSRLSSDDQNGLRRPVENLGNSRLTSDGQVSSRLPVKNPDNLRVPIENRKNSRLHVENPGNSRQSRVNRKNSRLSSDSQNSSRLHTENNFKLPLVNQGNSRLTSEDPNNSRLNVEDQSNLGILFDSIRRRHQSRQQNNAGIERREWARSGSTPSTPKPKAPPAVTEPVDFDKIIAHRYPQAMKLLEQLRQLNKIKEQQFMKRPFASALASTAPSASSSSFNNRVDKTTKPVYDPAAIEDLLQPEVLGVLSHTTTEANYKNGNAELKKITKRRFFFKAKPVKPANEVEQSKETIYY